eukprot:jgi/Botrbrau1/5287/Bobra.0391s0008.1
MSALYPPYSISNQVVLITGASAGIGEACAWRFAEQGCRLILTARRLDRLEALKSALEDQYKVAIHIAKLDMMDLNAIQEFPSSLPPEFQEVDILVNNAGLALGTNPVQDNDIEDAVTMINTNCTSVVAITKLFVKGMIWRDRGHIINMSSIAGKPQAYPGGSIYCGTKHFLDAFTNAARCDLVGTRIRVTSISPGAVKTEFSNVRFKGDTERADNVYAGIIPLTAADIADNVIYAATRPEHVQIGDITVFAGYQASAQNIARVLLKES